MVVHPSHHRSKFSWIHMSVFVDKKVHMATPLNLEALRLRSPVEVVWEYAHGGMYILYSAYDINFQYAPDARTQLPITFWMVRQNDCEKDKERTTLHEWPTALPLWNTWKEQNRRIFTERRITFMEVDSLTWEVILQRARAFVADRKSVV